MKLFKVADIYYSKFLFFENKKKYCFILGASDSAELPYFGDEAHSWLRHQGTHYL